MPHDPTKDALPDLPLEAWRDTKTTLHLYTQIVGKVRLALHPAWNHWWHVTLYPSARGLTTGAIPARGQLLELELDFLTHALAVRSSRGEPRSVPLHDGLTVAEFYTHAMQALRDLGTPVDIRPLPFDPPRVGSDIPFPDDRAHHHYDVPSVERFHRILAWSYGVLAEFRGRYIGKSTPPHFFWHSFDLALTRFSGRASPQPKTADGVTREAYSHEVISFGFWPGDDSITQPSYYAYAAPEPPDLRKAPLKPSQARWTGDASSMALLPYADVRLAPDPRGSLLAFLESAFEATASSEARWYPT